MTVSTIASIAAGISRTLGNQNAKLATSVRGLISGNQPNTAAHVADLAAATALQTQLSSLRIASQNIVQAGSMLEVAQGGTNQITSVLGQLQDLAVRASSGELSANERQLLNTQFQALRQEINRIATTTRFNGAPLLDGSGADQSLAIGGLTDADLFGGADVTILTPDTARAAVDAIATAQDYVVTQQSSIGALQEGLDYAAATVESALQNQDAARSGLGDVDFLEASTENAQTRLQAQATTSLLAQTNRLPANILQLLSE